MDAPTFDALLAATVRRAVADAIEPLRAEIAQLRAASNERGVSLEEAAERLNVSKRTVQRRVNSGEIPTVPGMRPVRIILSAVLGA